MVHSLAANLGWHVDTELNRWDPTAEDWADPDKPLSQSDREHAADGSGVTAGERDAVERHGRRGFEVGVRCPSHHEASQ